MNHTTYKSVIRPLMEVGISESDAIKLRRIAMTLHAWGEAECGTEHGCIERDEVTNKTYYRSSYGGCGQIVPDRETGALKRLTKIMSAYPSLSYYVQGDPRGAPLYIIRPGDVPEGAEADSYYNRGIAVYK